MKLGPEGSSAVDTPVLWHLETSHYNEKARWALDYKGVEHVRRAVTPGLQQLTARRLRPGRTVPILQIDERAIGDSTMIIEIEQRWPEPALYPIDPDERAAEFRRFRDSLRERPGFKWVEEMYARHRAASAEVVAA